MPWSEQAWQAAAPIYQNILQHPFITELMNGSLDKDCFRFYIAQDALYLGAFSRALALIAARAGDTDTSLQFIRFAEGAIVVEQALHASFFRELAIETAGAPAPAGHHYTNYLLAQAALAPIGNAMAAVLPCFWIYKQVGDYIYQQQQKGSNPYQSWIDTYAGEEFGLLVQKAIAHCDAMAAQATAEQQAQMTGCFVQASRFEWMFWDSAYRQEQWPV
ncbi:thiaminase /4-amino-5-aminomethyl-2-methylpyrimidine deaminase [Cnuella takakiae]|uniref:Aminopyrimidine aminohydrolase n=1 Tax=Cnuella takakiae TaxID=1302690 RepID=A0A1M5ER61_9BACT|nr:thiaminase II [Cnuella takakiae]OLY91264.1 thiaminase II [Cnuella takakiae]SHF81502.1 thiaminase /4-amino-5-aminomethyl-2-methylpyrimidine deaminase [Cnuella takakiae]